MMTCREFAEFMWQYVDGSLDARARFEFDAHLAVCPHCVSYLQMYVDTMRVGREVYQDPDAELPEHVPEQLIQAILAAREAAEE